MSNILNIGLGLGASFLLTIVFGWLGHTKSTDIEEGSLSAAGAQVL